MIGILCALDLEMQALLKDMNLTGEKNIFGMHFYEGMLRGHNLVLCKCGVGKVNAAVCAQTLMLTYSPSLIINLGVAGAIADDLHVGDVVVGVDAVQHDVDTSGLGDPVGLVSTVNITYFPLDEGARQVLLRAAAKVQGVRVRPGRIATGEQFICEAQAKKRIADTFHADVCEMEGGAIAQAAYIDGVKCAIVRSVSDGADDGAPMSYENFAKMAAANSHALIVHFLEEYR